MALPHFHHEPIEPIYNNLTYVYFPKLPKNITSWFYEMDEKYFYFYFNVKNNKYEPLNYIIEIIENDIIQDVIVTFQTKEREIFKFKLEKLKFLKIEDFFKLNYSHNNDMKILKVKYNFESLSYIKLPLNQKEERMMKLKLLTQDEDSFYKKILKDIFF